MADMTNPAERLDAAIDTFTREAEQLDAGQWLQPSPCEGWTAQQVLQHVCGTLTGILGMIEGDNYRETKYAGPTPDETPEQSMATWRELSAQVREAVSGLTPEQELTGPMGAAPALQALANPTHDLTVHAWDIAATAGRSVDIDPALLADLERLVRSVPEEILRSPGIFGPEVEPVAGASDTDRLMAFLGRRRPE